MVEGLGGRRKAKASWERGAVTKVKQRTLNRKDGAARKKIRPTAYHQREGRERVLVKQDKT